MRRYDNGTSNRCASVTLAKSEIPANQNRREGSISVGSAVGASVFAGFSFCRHFLCHCWCLFTPVLVVFTPVFVLLGACCCLSVTIQTPRRKNEIPFSAERSAQEEQKCPGGAEMPRVLFLALCPLMWRFAVVQTSGISEPYFAQSGKLYAWCVLPPVASIHPAVARKECERIDWGIEAVRCQGSSQKKIKKK